jgi:hypothetical protein
LREAVGMDEERFPILGKGEVYTTPIPAPAGGGSKKPIRSFDEARHRLLPQLESLFDKIDSCRGRHLMLRNKLFFQVSLDYEYLAKSYFPNSMVRLSQWEMVGSRPWHQAGRDDKHFDEAKLARMIFFQADPIAIESTYKRLEKGQVEKNERGDFVKVDSIGLQRAEDRLIGFPRGARKDVLAELIFHPMRARDWNECRTILNSLTNGRRRTSPFLWEWKRGEDLEPTFLPATLTDDEIRLLGDFNPIRAARPMPSISIPRVNRDRTKPIGKGAIRPIVRSVYPRIGIVDGGADTALPQLNGWVSNVDLTSEPPDESFMEHGTAVCGAALYGPIDPEIGLEPPKHKVKSFRVFPVPLEMGLNLDLYRVLDWIEEIVRDPSNKDIRIYSLSFGPDTPIDDQEVDRFTVTLDQLAYEYDVLFLVAAGNDGDLQYPSSRIQPPSDMVNGLGVGSFTYVDEREPCPASYSCVGPGRPGSQVKPDVSAFGGSTDYPFYVLLPNAESQVAANQGTSFSTPCVASVAANLLHRASEPTLVAPQTAKALIIHHAQPFFGLNRREHGWGALRAIPESLMECSGNEVKVLYNGILNLTQWHRLRLPFPDDLEFHGKIHFEWTFVYASGVRIETPDDYTLAGLEVTFRSHFHRFGYSKDGKSVKLDDRSDRAFELEEEGWRKSGHPLSCSYEKEEELREKGKWDTVLKGNVSLQQAKVYSPVLDVHALGRGEWEYRGGPGRINYAAVVTVRADSPRIRLYERVRSAMRDLVPIDLRVRVRRQIG